ncbi:hypothetical protein J2Y67_002542 [Neobacillus niacini]|nr:hypothetical protein [Neobacillus niacini]
MKAGEAYYIFQANGPLMFDENHQNVFPSGSLTIPCFILHT